MPELEQLRMSELLDRGFRVIRFDNRDGSAASAP